MDTQFSTTRRVLILGLLVQIGVLGGCPLSESGDRGALTASLPPGLYYVEKRSGAAQAFAFPQVRGDPGRWLELATVPDAYTGAGIYELSQQGDWALITAGGYEVLYDRLMLWDPAPQVPADMSSP